MAQHHTTQTLILAGKSDPSIWNHMGLYVIQAHKLKTTACKWFRESLHIKLLICYKLQPFLKIELDRIWKQTISLRSKKHNRKLPQTRNVGKTAGTCRTGEAWYGPRRKKTKQKHVYVNFSPHYTKLRDQYQYYIKCRGRCVLTHLTSVYCD